MHLIVPLDECGTLRSRSATTIQEISTDEELDVNVTTAPGAVTTQANVISSFCNPNVAIDIPCQEKGLVYGTNGKEQVLFKIRFQQGYHSTPSALAEHLNLVIRTHPEGCQLERFVTFSPDDVTRSIYLSVKHSQASVRFVEKGFAKILGFYWRGLYHKGDYPSNVFRPSPALEFLERSCILNVYCDVPELQFHGSAKANILRTIPLSTRRGEYIWETFQPVHYISVLNKHLKSIHCWLYDDLGKALDFRSGRTILKLHFRRRARALF